ncbi:hypothetical protein A3B18_00230 [Candidatus Giovannonibacteria bacterium RIFCSPLOWO2_01_FULL_46_13]|uniref:Uncharacterized protein n=1 Tax=Candidatus Giovannonibacteria bacterium RIFCSPLOWO2_01_FULL_46_13 TaxID=1798352 RepID=A0A1F5X4L1_9BACT|nr:MAG: hypothetical protein A3B18_00230 [Candidatus Giovannonibacteria bacterium RIFCSPLOWO2_01_FULL_46_13]
MSGFSSNERDDELARKIGGIRGVGLAREAKLVTAGKLQELLLEAVTAIIAENAKPGAKVDAELVKLLGEADAFFSSFAVRVHEYLEREKK